MINGTLSMVDADAGDVASLAYLHVLTFDEAWSRDAMAGALNGPGGFAFITHARRRTVGFVLGRTTGEECKILTLAVPPVLRRQGPGPGAGRAAVGASRDRWRHDRVS